MMVIECYYVPTLGVLVRVLRPFTELLVKYPESRVGIAWAQTDWSVLSRGYCGIHASATSTYLGLYLGWHLARVITLVITPGGYTVTLCHYAYAVSTTQLPNASGRVS